MIFDSSLSSSEESLPEVVSKRPWGGIPMIYSFGDSAQLPPVMMKPYFDESYAKPGSSDMAGRIAMADFMNPDETTAK